MAKKKEKNMSLGAFVSSVERKLEERGSEYYVVGGMIPERYVDEHDKGHRPIGHIEKDYLQEQGINVSMEFFKWYLKNHCEPCGCKRMYGSGDAYTELDFYDIVACCKKLKESDIKDLKDEYKKYTADKKADNNMSDEYYYAKIVYQRLPTKEELDWEERKGKDQQKEDMKKPEIIEAKLRVKKAKQEIEKAKQENIIVNADDIKEYKEIIKENQKIIDKVKWKDRRKLKEKQARDYEAYAIIYRDWAYINPAPPNFKVSIRADKEYPRVIEKYKRLPKKMSQEKVNAILKRLKKTYPNMKLAKFVPQSS